MCKLLLRQTQLSVMESSDLDGSHERAGHAAVGDEASQDEEGSPPPEAIKQELVQWRQRGQEDGAPRHGQPVSNRTLDLEVLADDGEGRLQVECQAETWSWTTRKIKLSETKWIMRKTYLRFISLADLTLG